MADDTFGSSNEAPPVVAGGITIGSPEDKAWLFRVLAVHALAGLTTEKSLEVAAEQIGFEAEDASREHRLGLLLRSSVQVLEGLREDETKTVADFFATIHVTLTIWERTMLSVPIGAIEDAEARARIFFAVADMTRK